MTDRTSFLATAGGLLILLIGVVQFLFYGFIPLNALDPGLQQLVGLFLMSTIPLLLVTALWLKYSSALPEDNHIHDLLLAAFGASILVQAVLIWIGPIQLSVITAFSLESVFAFIGGLIGLASTLVLAFGGYCLVRQPGNRTDGARWTAYYHVYAGGGVVLGLYVMIAGLELIHQILLWTGTRSFPLLAAAFIIWLVVFLKARLFALKSVLRLHTDTEQEELFDRFAPDSSPLNDLWNVYGFELQEADEQSARFRLETRGTDISMEVDQIEADRPGIREMRLIEDGSARSTVLMAFTGCGDGADVTLETVTERRLTVYELVIMAARSLFDRLYLEQQGYEIEEEWTRLAFHRIEHEF